MIGPSLPFVSFCFVSATGIKNPINARRSSFPPQGPNYFDFGSLSLYYDCLRSISFRLFHARL
jgi:hypothetical protein